PPPRHSPPRPLPPPPGPTPRPRRAVAVEQAAMIERAERSRRDHLAHAHKVRLEAVVVGDVADGAVLSRRSLELRDRFLFRGPQGLLHQDVLAIAEEVIEDRDLGLVGNAGEHRVVAAEREVLDGPIFGLAVDGIDCRYEIGACDLPAFLTLNAESRHHDSHQTAPWPSLEASLLLDHVDAAQQVRSSDWNI